VNLLNKLVQVQGRAGVQTARSAFEVPGTESGARVEKSVVEEPDKAFGSFRKQRRESRKLARFVGKGQVGERVHEAVGVKGQVEAVRSQTPGTIDGDSSARIRSW
jgi:hypothetical protein